MGKRQIGDMQPSDLVATILISNMAALPIEDINIPMLVGAVPILALAGSELIISNLTLKYKGFRHLITGRPVILIQNGEFNQKAMKNLRLSIDDIQEAARSSNIFNFEDIHYAIAETNGNISFLQKFAKQTATAEMLSIKGSNTPLPHVIISDGKIFKEGLANSKLGEGWLNKTLKDNKLSPADIFLMTADENTQHFIVKKR